MPPIDYTDYDALSDSDIIGAQLIVTKRINYYLKHIRGLLIFIAGATAVIGVKSFFELIVLFN
jgi:hypothetical protein